MSTNLPNRKVSVKGPISTRVPRHLVDRLVFLPDQAATMGTLLVGLPGVGKSTVIGRIQAFQYFRRGIPCIVFDPTGGASDNFLDKLLRQPKEVQRRLWPRVRYVNCAGTDEWVTPMPLLYRSGNERLFEISQRLTDVWARLDPNLQTASIQGWNSLHPLATACGILLSAMGCQITEAADLVEHVSDWADRIDQTVTAHPSTLRASKYLQEEFGSLQPREQGERSQAYLAKVRQLTWDPVSEAMYGANSNGFDWGEVVKNRLIVFCDFREIKERETLRFRLLWLMRSVIDYIRQRGPGFHHVPLAWIIDELTMVLSSALFSEELITSDVEELVSRLARSHKIWLTLALQDIGQVGQRMQRLLLRLGTKVFGSVQDVETALELAHRFYRFDPYSVKLYEPVYGQTFSGRGVIDEKPIYLTREEQQELSMVNFLNLPRYHFLVSTATAEGTISSKLRPLSIENLDRGQYVNEDLVKRARRELQQRDGHSVAKLLADITTRQAAMNPAGRRQQETQMARRVKVR